MLKPCPPYHIPPPSPPAAFRRLCVETHELAARCSNAPPAAFRRLCVETKETVYMKVIHDQPPSGGCVLKPAAAAARTTAKTSRLQAAVC